MDQTKEASHTAGDRTKPIQIDVAIVGGGPAGLQAALVLARTRKKVVVFDAPAAPRNEASHGVHNFVGLDGLLPQQIRDQAWGQIELYDSASLIREAVGAIERDEDSGDLILTSARNAMWQARHVILTCGYSDQHPEIDGFGECWARTIIPCPFCDGFENRDRLWGIVVTMDLELDAFPTMVQNWTDRRIVIVPPTIEITAQRQAKLHELNVDIHVGVIADLDHDSGMLNSVTLDTGEIVYVETLLWTPPEAPAALVTDLTSSLGLALDEYGYVAVDDAQHTNVDRLWAAGDVQGWMGAIESATAGSLAATSIAHRWFETVEATAQ